MKKTIAALAALLLLCVSVSAKEYTSGSFVISDGEKAPIPEAYTFLSGISVLSDGTALKAPGDVFVKDGEIFIADTGNNRVVKISAAGELLAQYTLEEYGGLNAPEGIFILETGDIYIADTENKRIVRLDAAGEFIEEYGKPSSDLIEADLVFAPSRIAVDGNGLIYVLCKTKLQGLFTMNAENEFKGYVGGNEVGFSLTDMLVRMFGSAEQKKKIVRRSPPAAAGFAQSGEYIYTVVNHNNETVINKFNSIGKNLYRTKPSNMILAEEFTDIDESAGIITAIDGKTCNVYQFDQEGNLLCVFGSKGEGKEQFSLPSAVASDGNGNVYVLDSVKNSLRIFQPNTFMKTVHEACVLYNDGLYESSKSMWEEVLKMNESYSLAYNGIAEALYCEGRYEEAMEAFYNSGNREGYSKSFDDYRHGIFRRNFTLAAVSIAAVCTAVILIMLRIKKYAYRKY